jgi:hypothetical protein
MHARNGRGITSKPKCRGSRSRTNASRAPKRGFCRQNPRYDLPGGASLGRLGIPLGLLSKRADGMGEQPRRRHSLECNLCDQGRIPGRQRPDGWPRGRVDPGAPPGPVDGSHRPCTDPHIRQNWNKCKGRSCSVAIDHEKTQALIQLIAGTPKALLAQQITQWCSVYLSPIAWACPIFAAEAVLGSYVFSDQLKQNDNGRGVVITFITSDIREFGILPQ